MNGLHHVTAIAGPAARNLDFYTRVLGLRLVKKTVNFDDPGTYHLYYGDGGAAPGTILTFFPWEHAAPGQLGAGEALETVFRVPGDAIGFWAGRLGVRPGKRFGETVLTFTDPDGMRLAITGVPGIEAEPAWQTDGIGAGHAIRGFHGVGLNLADAGPTGAILTDVFGFARTGQDGDVVRFQVGAAGAGAAQVGGTVDIRIAPHAARGQQGAGSVHHIAYRAADDAGQAAMVRRLAEHHRIATTEQKDRNYFRSVYFREPGGVLFEIATDIPGFAVDEPAAKLGQALKLPPSLEPRRAELERRLPALD
jgi:glyoxalase family protein